MTKRDIIALISPSIVFAVIAVFALLDSSHTSRRHERDRASQHLFDSVIADVQAGKRQLTTEETVELARQSQIISESAWQADADASRMMRDFACISMLGILWQLSVTFRLRKKWRQP